MQKEVFFPVLGLCLWALFWIGLICFHPDQSSSGPFRSNLSHPASGSALRATAVEGSSKQGLEQNLHKPKLDGLFELE
jgi:hypothetical protein